MALHSLTYTMYTLFQTLSRSYIHSIYKHNPTQDKCLMLEHRVSYVNNKFTVNESIYYLTYISLSPMWQQRLPVRPEQRQSQKFYNNLTFSQAHARHLTFKVKFVSFLLVCFLWSWLLYILILTWNFGIHYMDQCITG